MKMAKKRLPALVFTLLILIFAPAALILAKSHNEAPGLQGQSGQGKALGKLILLEPRGNKFKVTRLDEEGEKIEDGEEAEDVEELQIEVDGDQEPEGEGPEQPVTVKARDNAALVIRNKLAAQTNFPLIVNLETNELIVNTPHGQKTVTVLPDAAVANMLAANVLDQPGGKGGFLWLQSQPTATVSATPTATVSATPTMVEEPVPTATPSGEPTATPSAEPTEAVESVGTFPIRLVLTDAGVLAYEIDGVKTERLFRLFKVKLNRVVVVSAETGELLEIQQSLLTKILDFLSA